MGSSKNCLIKNQNHGKKLKEKTGQIQRKNGLLNRNLSFTKIVNIKNDEINNKQINMVKGEVIEAKIVEF